LKSNVLPLAFCFTLTLALTGCSSLFGPKPIAKFNVRDYGAKGDNTTKDTAAFQQALEACKAAGGGEVIVPAGNYLLGSVEMYSDTTLRLEKDVFVVESPDLADYPLIDGKFEGEKTKVHRGLIYAENAKNITIAGPGGFSACSAIAPQRNPRAPVVIELVSCDHATLDGFNLQYDRTVRTDIWCIHPMYCTNLTAKNLYIRSQGTNGDGIDVDSCSGVLVDNCDISAGDDAISLKSGRGMDAVRTAKPTENVLIKNSTLASVHYAALGIGTEISGGVRNVRIENCTISGVQNAIFIKSRDGRGGYMESIVGENLIVEKSPTFIGIDLMSKGIAGLEPVPGDVDMWTRVQNITFKNVKLNDVGYIVQVQKGTGRAVTNPTTQEPNLGVAAARPIDGFTLENVTGTAQHGFVLLNMKNVHFSGINVTGYTGPLYTLTNVTGQGLDEPAAP
jgi:polygalacturonase